MPPGAERPLDQALAETVEFVESALKRSAPSQGLLDLQPFDHRAEGLTHRQRREIALNQLPAVIPLPFRPDAESDDTAREGRPVWLRRVSLWGLFLLTVVSIARPELSLLFGVVWLVVLIWPTRSRSMARGRASTPASDDLLGGHTTEPSGGHTTELELRIIWMARWQTAAIVHTRAWGSAEMSDGVGRIDISDVLGRLTDRALNLLRFTSTTLPTPSRSQPELRQQWEREAANRCDSGRTHRAGGCTHRLPRAPGTHLGSARAARPDGCVLGTGSGVRGSLAPLDRGACSPRRGQRTA